MNFGESKTECALGYAKNSIKQAVLDDATETYKKLADSQADKPAEPEVAKAKPTKKPAKKPAKAEPEATKAEPVKA